MSRLFRQDQDQDQDFFFKTKTKTKTIFHDLEAPRDQDQGLETTSLVLSRTKKNRRKGTPSDLPQSDGMHIIGTENTCCDM